MIYWRIFANLLHSRRGNCQSPTRMYAPQAAKSLPLLHAQRSMHASVALSARCTMASLCRSSPAQMPDKLDWGEHQQEAAGQITRRHPQSSPVTPQCATDL